MRKRRNKIEIELDFVEYIKNNFILEEYEDKQELKDYLYESDLRRGLTYETYEECLDLALMHFRDCDFEKVYRDGLGRIIPN